MINWEQDFLSFNSVCNHTCDKQIGLPLRGRPILLITRMITDRIGLHSVLLSLLIKFSQSVLKESFVEEYGEMDTDITLWNAKNLREAFWPPTSFFLVLHRSIPQWHSSPLPSNQPDNNFNAFQTSWYQACLCYMYNKRCSHINKPFLKLDEFLHFRWMTSLETKWKRILEIFKWQ